jgi:hypothetical protein
MNKRNIVAVLGSAALAVPTAAVANPGHGTGDEKHAAGHAGNETAKGKARNVKKVTFVFRGTFSAPGTVTVAAGNTHVRKGGFIGKAVAFDLSKAKIVVADTNGDQSVDLTDVKAGDQVLVQARLSKGTKYAAPADGEIAAAFGARQLVNNTNPPTDD